MKEILNICVKALVQRYFTPGRLRYRIIEFSNQSKHMACLKVNCFGYDLVIHANDRASNVQSVLYLLQ